MYSVFRNDRIALYLATCLAGFAATACGDDESDNHDHDHDHDHGSDHEAVGTAGHAGRGGAGSAANGGAGKSDTKTAGAGGASGAKAAGAPGGKAGTGDRAGDAGKSKDDAGSSAGHGGAAAGVGGHAGAARHAGEAGADDEAGGQGGAAGADDEAGGAGGSDEAGEGGAAAGAGGGAGGSGPASPVTVTLRFKASVRGEDFACGKQYNGIGSAGTTVAPQDFRMFVYDVALLRDDGGSVPVQVDERGPWQSQGVTLIDFEDGTGQCVEGNPETNTEITGSVPAGTYTGVSFSNGIPEALNHSDPGTLMDPFKTYANLSWGWLTGFRFVKAELAQVVAPGAVFGVGLVHPGATACSGNTQEGTVTCAKLNHNHVVLNDFAVDKDVIAADIGAIFAETNLTETAECHSSGSYCAPMFDALGIDFATGKPKDGQTVFSKQ